MSILATLPLIRVARVAVTGSSQRTISFDAIRSLVPAGTKHLMLEVNASQTYTERRFCEVRINGDTGNNYDYRDFSAAGTVVTSRHYLNQDKGQGVDVPSVSSNHFGGGYMFFPYAFRTDNLKLWHSMGSSLETRLARHISVGENTAAITSIAIQPWQNVPSTNNWTTGSIATLYAIDERYLIEEQVLSADGAFNFTNFPSVANHMVFAMQLRGNYVNALNVGDRIYHQLNGDTAVTRYTMQRFGGEKIPNDVILDDSSTEQRIGWSSALDSPTNSYGSLVAMYPEYRNTTFYQPWFSQHGTFDYEAYFPVSQENGRWENTAAITALKVFPKTASGEYLAGSRIGAYRPSGLASRQVVGASGAASVTLSVPAGVIGLRAFIVARSDANQIDDRVMLVLNADTAASNYVSRRASAMNGNHETAETADNEIGVIPAAIAGAGIFGCGALAIPQHGSTNRHKHFLSAMGASGGRLALYGGRWKNWSAVTSVTFTPKTGSKFLPGSAFELSFAADAL